MLAAKPGVRARGGAPRAAARGGVKENNPFDRARTVTKPVPGGTTVATSKASNQPAARSATEGRPLKQGTRTGPSATNTAGIYRPVRSSHSVPATATGRRTYGTNGGVVVNGGPNGTAERPPAAATVKVTEREGRPPNNGAKTSGGGGDTRGKTSVIRVEPPARRPSVILEREKTETLTLKKGERRTSSLGLIGSRSSIISSTGELAVNDDNRGNSKEEPAAPRKSRLDIIESIADNFDAHEIDEDQIDTDDSSESGIGSSLTKSRDEGLLEVGLPDDGGLESGSSSLRVFSQDETVGFGHLPDQVYRKAVKKGFEFSLMVVGESGLGKSTLVNSMFLTNIYSSHSPSLKEAAGQTLQVEAHHISLEEKGVKLNLTVVDTPGFGDAVDNSNCWAPIINYIDNQFEKYLEEENRVKRDTSIQDSRVHACLYFIAPTGHGLKPLDVEFMRKIHKKVNIIPVIGKADCCTKREVIHFKNKVLTQLKEMKIETYGFPESELSEDDLWMRDRLPFAVVGSNAVIHTENGTLRGREYSWGTVDIENKDHCDFSPLRCLLLSHHMQDLREVTHTQHYENYRSDKLAQPSFLLSHQTSYPSKSLPGLPLALQDEEEDEGDDDDSEANLASLHSDLQTEAMKKKWVLKWSQGRLDLEKRMVPTDRMLPPQMGRTGRAGSMSLSELRYRTSEGINGGAKSLKSLINQIHVKRTPMQQLK